MFGFHTPRLSLLRSIFLTGVRAPFFACPKKEAKKRTSQLSGLRLPENRLILNGTDRLAPARRSLSHILVLYPLKISLFSALNKGEIKPHYSLLIFDRTFLKSELERLFPESRCSLRGIVAVELRQTSRRMIL